MTIQKQIEAKIEELKVQQEELEECGDLEERLACSEKLAHLESLVGNPNIRWITCGLCYGKGTHTEYGHTWTCPCCEGECGSWF